MTTSETTSGTTTFDTGEVVWRPPADVLATTRVGAFLHWLRDEHGVDLTGHDELWQWSVDELEQFWAAIWDFFDVTDHGSRETVLAQRVMPGARWFPGSLLNYAEQALKGCGADNAPAVLARSQTRADVDLTWAQLRDQVGRARRVLRDHGIGPGDRVAGYLPNSPEAVVAFLAAAGLGAIWTGCAIEFGARSVIDRLGQVEPTVLLVAGGYTYGDKRIDRSEQIAAVRAELPTVNTVFDIEYGDWRTPDADAVSWRAAVEAVTEPILETTPVPFDHPLVVLFSSGTTGKPKAIVHGHGGIVLEHLKNHGLSWDLRSGDVMLWYSTTAWMMWNALVSGLLVGSTIVLLDGNPGYPDLRWQWDLAEQTGATLMGASPGFIMACRRAGLDLTGRQLRIRVVGSAGSPLPPEGYAWIRDQLGDRVQLNVGSGGTDVCSGLVQNNPLLPVRAGMISGRALGVDVHAFDPEGHELIGEPGELVVLSPMPSMPVGFWGDDGTRLRAAYFDTYPGVWRHGDWIIFEADGRCIVTGRSDATLNRGGVRLGTAEFYRVVEELPEVGDSLVIHLEDPAGGNGELILFVTTTRPVPADELRSHVSGALRTALSPRHVPDRVVEVAAVPRNLTGKKLEVPVKRILQGAKASDVVSADALADPTSIDPYVAYATRRRGKHS